MKKIFSFLLLLIISCSLNISISKQSKQIKKVIKIKTKNFDKRIKKALFTNEGYLYILSENFIYIYHDNSLINKIGGIGFDNDNFSQISDFSISSTGNLLVLDGLLKQLKIFDKKGSLLKTIVSSNYPYPVLFDILDNDTIYLYDQSLDEIFVTKNFSDKYDFSFGKFDFQNPISLNINNDYLVVNTKFGKTFIYNNLGQLIKKYDNFIQIENGIIFSKKRYAIICNNKEIINSYYPIKSFIVKSNFLVLNSNKTIEIYKIEYD